jgi:O-antigen/teichoic acid export membrane protein
MNDKFGAGRSLSYNLILNIIWNFFGQAWMLVITLLAMPFIIHRLGVDLYALYALIGVIIGYFAFLQFGFGTASVKYIAQYLAAKDEINIRKTFWSCLFIYALMGLAGAVTIAVLAHTFVDRFLKIPAELKELSLLVLRIGSFGFFVSMILAAIGSVMQALGRFDILGRIGIILASVQIVITVILLKVGLSIEAVVISGIVVQIAGIFIYWGHAKRLLPFLARPALDMATIKYLFRFGGMVAVSGIVGPVLMNTEKIFLTIFRPMSALTYYSVPCSIVYRLTIIPSAFTSVLFTTFSYFGSTNSGEINKDLHYRGALYIFFCYAFFMVFFIIFGKSFLALWLGNDFAEKSTNILTILLTAGLINVIASPSFSFLQAVGKPYLPAVFHVVEVIVYIPAAWVLIRRFGGYGAAFAWLLRVTLDTLLLHAASAIVLKESVFAWYGRLFYRGLPPLLVSGFLFLCLRSLGLYLIDPLNIAGIIVIFILYACMVWKWGLDEIMRNNVLEFLRGKNTERSVSA